MADKNNLIALVNTNLPDNNEAEITPAKVREVDQQIITYNLNLDETTKQTTSGALDLSAGVTSLNIVDDIGQVYGRFIFDDYFGLGILGRDANEEKTPITIDSSTTLISSEQLALVFNGAAKGDFLRITDQADINGQTVNVIGTTPLDVIEYSESFSFSGADTVLTTSYQSIVSGTAANEYRADTSQAITAFRLFNGSSNQAAEVQFYITVDGAPPAGDDEQTVTVPKGNGEFIVSFDDTSQSLVAVGGVVEVFVKQVTGAAGQVSVTSSTYTTTLDLVQNASIQNAIQSVQDISAGTTLSGRKYYRITNQGVYNLPLVSSVLDQQNPFTLLIANDSGVDIDINANVADTIKTTIGDSQLITIKDGETFTLVAGGSNKWFITANYSSASAGLGGFIAKSSDTISVSTDKNNPSFLTGFTMEAKGYSLFDAATGAVRNDTGKDQSVDGLLSFNPDKDGGGGTATVKVFSETSIDNGVSYQLNSGSLRPVELSNSSESFKTMISFVLNWPAGAIVRFRAYSIGAMSFEPSTDTVLGGQTITGYSVIWNLSKNHDI